MSSQVCRLLVLAVRSACCRPTCRSSARVPGPPRVPAQRRAYSLDSLSSGPGRPPAQQAKAERTSPSIGLAQRNLSAAAVSVQGQCRPLYRYDFLDLGGVEENTLKAKAVKRLRRFIVDPAIASLVAHHLGPDLEDSRAAIFECNPGPGVLTRTLLNAGAQKVVALESSGVFIPELRELEGRLDGLLQVFHCDFFKLDPLGGHGHVRAPAMCTDKLFTHLGIPAASWTDDVPVKVVGIGPQKDERSQLWKLLYRLFERLSVFHYGRVELNLFISEKEYLTMVAKPGDKRSYMAFGALWQMACDIQLLHKEPWSSFATSAKTLNVRQYVHLPNDHLCLVRLTPRKDLFSGQLCPANASTLVLMVKQCLARKVPLIDKLNLWSPGSGAGLLSELGLPENVHTCHVSPAQYLRLFTLMEQSQEFAQSWLYHEILENSQRLGYG